MAAAALIFTPALGRMRERVEDALGGRGDPSKAMSECLDRTKSLSVLLWVGGGLVFGVLAAALFMRSPLGPPTSSSPRSSPRSSPWSGATRWASIASPTAAAEAGQRVHYTGSELSLGKKIAIVFIGSLTISWPR